MPQLKLTQKGMDILWLSIGSTIMALTLIVFAFQYSKMRSAELDQNIVQKKGENMTTNKNKQYQRFLATVVVVLALISYIAMLLATIYSTQSNVTLIRYIEWFITTPLLLLDLALLAMMSEKHINLLIILDIFMILLGLGAVYANNTVLKYSLFTLSTISMIGIFYILFNPQNKSSELDSEAVKKSENANIYTTVLWTMYPIVWMFGSSSLKYLSIPNETLLYMILDVLAKALFGIIFVFS